MVESENVIVFARAGDAIAVAAGAEGLIMTSERNFVVAHQQEPRFVPRLYLNGAWLVWPSMPRECLALNR